MTHPSPSSGRARRALTEVAVVVVGVLIALAAESWWADRQEARIELEYLVQLEGDLQGLVAEIEASIDEETRILEQLQDAARSLVQGDPEEPFAVGFTTSVPTLRNGGLAQVDAIRGPILAREPALRARIADLAAFVATSDRLLAGFFEDVVDNLRIALVEIARLQQVHGRITTVGHARGNPEILTAVSFHGIALQNRISTLERLLESARGTRAALRTVLDAEGIPDDTGAPDRSDTEEASGAAEDSGGVADSLSRGVDEPG